MFFASFFAFFAPTAAASCLVPKKYGGATPSGALRAALYGMSFVTPGAMNRVTRPLRNTHVGGTSPFALPGAWMTMCPPSKKPFHPPAPSISCGVSMSRWNSR